MKTRKIIALILAIVMLAAFVAACADDPTPPATDDPAPPPAVADDDDDPAPPADDDDDLAPPAADDGLMLRMVIVGAPSEAHDSVLEAVNAQLAADGYNFGVTIDFFDDYWSQLTLAVTGGEVIDLVWMHRNYIGENVRLGMLQPIDAALAAYGPVLLEHTPDFLLAGGSVGGQQFGMPRVAPMSYNRSVLNIRGDLREAHGIPPITTIDHLEQFLEAVHENEEGVYGAMGWLPETLYPVYVDAHFILNWLLYVQPEDGTVQSLWHSEGMESIMARIWSWADRGWIPTDEVRERFGGTDAAFDNGFVAVVNANPMRAAERIDQFTANVPDGRVETVVLQSARPMNFFSGDNMLAVPTTSNNVNEAVQFVNWIKSNQDNFDLFSFGVEGVNYHLVDGAVDTSAIGSSEHYSISRWMWDDIRLARFSANMTDADVNQLRTWDDGIALSPYLEFTLDESEIGILLGAIWGVVWDNIPQWTTGQAEFDRGRTEFLAALDAAGIQEVIEEAQRQLDEFMAGR